MAQVARTRQVSPTERVQLRRPSLRRFVATGAAAAVLAGTAALGGVAWQNHQDANHSKIVAARAAELTRVLTDPDHRETVAESSVGGTATVFAAQGKAVLALNQLPAPPRGKTYQVWRIDRNAVIGSAGLLDLTAGRGQQLISGVSPGDTIAVSVEPSGGSKQPTTQPVVTVKVA
jgi:anti-sigma-K factor RskA